MKNFFKLLPHLNVITSFMVLTFLIIDRFNNSMQFIENDITKGILAVFAVLALINSVILMIYQRKD